jgi:hypothetical protein
MNDEIRKSIKKYNNENMINFFIKYKKKDNKLGEYIHNNYNKFDEYEIKKVAMECLTIAEMKRIILEYELTNYKYEGKNMTNEEYISEVMKNMIKFNKRAGGDYIDNLRWEYNNEHNRFENSIDIALKNNPDILDYLNKLGFYLDNIALNKSVDLEFEEIDKMIYIYYVIEDNK